MEISYVLDFTLCCIICGERHFKFGEFLYTLHFIPEYKSVHIQAKRFIDVNLVKNAALKYFQITSLGGGGTGSEIGGLKRK